VTDARYTYTAGMPAARVGWLVARARSVAAITDRDLASAVGVPVRTVRRWERGDLVPSDDEVEAIASACGARLTELLPRRAAVRYEPATGIMQMAGQAVAIPVTSLDNDTVLAAFVALVRRVRGLRLDQDVRVRQEDLDSLGEVLDLDDEELEERLMRIIGLSRSQAAAIRAQLLRRRLAVPMVGMLASLSLIGVSRFFSTGTEQVKAIDDKIETPRPTRPSTTTSVVSQGPVSTSEDVAVTSTSAAAPTVDVAPTTAAPVSVSVPVITDTPFIGPQLPRTGPPATSRRTNSNTGTQPPGAPPAAPTPVATSPATEPPAPVPPPYVAPTSPPVLDDGHTTGTTSSPTTNPPPTDPPPTNPPSTTPPSTTPPPTDPPPPVTTIDGGHTTGTTTPPTTSPPTTSPPSTISGPSTLGSEPVTS
jgi:transcriptional regulator with XRE-family HTH domain